MRLRTILLICAFLVTQLPAAEYFVSPTGSDTNNGLSEATPLKTFSALNQKLVAGDIATFLDGTYPEKWRNLTKSGTADAPIVLRSKNKHGAILTCPNQDFTTILNVIKANYVTIDGFVIDGTDTSAVGTGTGEKHGISIQASHHVTVRNCRILNCWGNGIGAMPYTWDSTLNGFFHASCDFLLLENNLISGCGFWNKFQCSGISIYQARSSGLGTDPSGFNIIIRRNQIWGCANKITTGGSTNPADFNQYTLTDGNGIIIDDFWNNQSLGLKDSNGKGVVYPHQTLIENNLIAGNGGRGIHMFYSNNATIRNNVCWGNNLLLKGPATYKGELNNAFAANVKWYNNIAVATPESIAAGGVAIFFGQNASTGVSYANNLVVGPVQVLDTTLFTETQVKNLNLITTDIKCVNPGINLLTADFRPKADSPAIDAGSATAGHFAAIDILGTSRPKGAKPDIGAYEYTTGTVGNQPPTVATAAAAVANPVAGTTVVLSALGADDGGEAALTYSWATTGTVPAAVSFASNGVNAAKSTTATFTKAGSYAFRVTITDPAGESVTSTVTLQVAQTGTSITVTPTTVPISAGASQTFAASARDQFGTAMATQPAITWSLASGGGTISAGGVYTAPATGTGTATVRATAGSLQGNATVTYGVATPPTPANKPTVTVGSDRRLTISGTAGAGQTAHIFIDSSEVAAVIAAGNGAWTYTTTSAFSPGSYTIAFTLTNGIGPESGSSPEASVTVPGNEYFVSPTGSDTNNGLSEASPLKTFSALNQKLVAGDIATFLDGTYPEKWRNLTKSGTAGAPIVLRSKNKHGAILTCPNQDFTTILNVIKANYVTIDGFVIDGTDTSAVGAGTDAKHGISIQASHHVTVRNCRILNCWGNGIGAMPYTWDESIKGFTHHTCDFLVLEDNLISGCGFWNKFQCSGISIYQARSSGLGTDPSGFNIIIRRNQIWGCANKITTGGSTNPADFNQNTLTDGNGIIIDDFWNNQSLGLKDSNGKGVIYPHQTLIENNIIAGNGGRGIHMFFSDNATIRNNVCWGNNLLLKGPASYKGELNNAFAANVKWYNNIAVATPESIAAGGVAIFFGQNTSTGVSYANNLVVGPVQVLDTTLFTETQVKNLNLITTDIKCVNPGINLLTADFRPKADSPAIDAGSATAGHFAAIDILGTSRPKGAKPDIGAYEYTTGTVGNQPPTVATAAAAVANPVAGTTVVLSALGADDGGEAALTYTWATTGAVPAAVSFASNGVNAAKSTTATFSKAGSYAFRVTIRDAANATVTSDVTVQVAQTLTSIALSPSSTSLVNSATQTFSATARDQFATALATQPSFTWAVSAGVGTVSPSGTYTAPASGTGTATVRASSGAVQATASVTVTSAPVGNQPPTVATAAAAAANPVTGTTVVLSALGADDGGEAALTYTWATTGTVPAAVSFASNGVNAAKSTTATFTKAGSYAFRVTIRDAANATVTSDVTVQVAQTLTSIALSPSSSSLVNSATQTFSATARDQFATALATQPSFTWAVSAGLGTVSPSGTYTAPASGTGTATVQVSSGAVQATASVAVGAVVPATPGTGPTVTTLAGNQLVVSGMAAAGQTVRVFVNGIEVGVVTAGADGSWSYTTAAVGAGTHTVTYTLANSGSAQSGASPATSVTIIGGGANPATDAAGDSSSGGGCGIGAIAFLGMLLMALACFGTRRT